MPTELIALITMVGISMLLHLAFQCPVGISMVIGSISGALIDGQGIPLRHLFEGTFVYIDTMLIIATAMIFMRCVEASGMIESLNLRILRRYHNHPRVMLLLLMAILVLPGMITGSSAAAILSTGGILVPMLRLLGIPAPRCGALLALGGVLGMAMPPVNVPAMLIASGVDMPYAGFDLPLLLLCVPSALASALVLGGKYCTPIDYDLACETLGIHPHEKESPLLYLPLFVLLVLMFCTRLFPSTPLDLGFPLIFLLASGCTVFTGRRFPLISTIGESVTTALPVLAKLTGVGMFLQILTLTGGRGLIVVTCLSMGRFLFYVTVALGLPGFGAISSYGSASVLAIPFLLSMPTEHQVIAAATLSYLCCLGDLMPPTAISGTYAADMVEERYHTILRLCVPIISTCILLGVVVLVIINHL